jgi:hypothetical protein
MTTLTCRRCGLPIELEPDADPDRRPTYHDTPERPCWAEQLQANRDADWRRFTSPPGSGAFYTGN